MRKISLPVKRAGKIHKNDNGREFDGDFYCEACYLDKFGTCADCDNTFDNDDLTEHNGDIVCRDCLLDRQEEDNKEAEIEQE
jgi:hypothetical protein